MLGPGRFDEAKPAKPIPLSRLYYAASTTICAPNALSQSDGLALGAEAGPERLAEALVAAGFDDVRVVAETEFNVVIQARR